MKRGLPRADEERSVRCDLQEAFRQDQGRRHGAVEEQEGVVRDLLGKAQADRRVQHGQQKLSPLGSVGPAHRHDVQTVGSLKAQRVGEGFAAPRLESKIMIGVHRILRPPNIGLLSRRRRRRQRY